MPLYRVSMIGVGFRKVVDGEEGRYSFLTTAFVEADSVTLAGEDALAALGARPDLDEQLRLGGPRLAIERVVEWHDAVPGAARQGLAWYPDPIH